MNLVPSDALCGTQYSPRGNGTFHPRLARGARMSFPRGEYFVALFCTRYSRRHHACNAANKTMMMTPLNESAIAALAPSSTTVVPTRLLNHCVCKWDDCRLFQELAFTARLMDGTGMTLQYSTWRQAGQTVLILLVMILKRQYGERLSFQTFLYQKLIFQRGKCSGCQTSKKQLGWKANSTCCHAGNCQPF